MSEKSNGGFANPSMNMQSVADFVYAGNNERLSRKSDGCLCGELWRFVRFRVVWLVRFLLGDAVVFG